MQGRQYTHTLRAASKKRLRHSERRETRPGVLFDRPLPPTAWRPGRIAIRPVPGGFAMVDSTWPGDGEICRVTYGDGMARDPIDLKDRWFFIAKIAEAWNEMAPYADMHEHE